MADKEFKVGIILDSSGLVKGVEDSSGALVKFNQELGQSQDELKGTEQASEDMASGQAGVSSSLTTSFQAVTALNQALEIGQKVYSAFTDAVASTTEAFSVQELAEEGVANALKLTNQFTEESFQGWKSWASAVQNATTTGDETTLGLVKQATAIGLTEKQTKTLIKASIDLSAVTGKSVQGSFRQLQGTYSGVATSLERLGLDVKQFTADEIKAGAAVDLVAKKFEGLAEAQTKTFTGANIQAANAFGDVLEEIGKLFVEVLDLTGRGKFMTEFWVDVGAAVGATREAFVEAKAVISSVLDLPWGKLANAASIVGGLTVATLALAVATGTASASTMAFIASLVTAGKVALATAAKYAALAIKTTLIAAGIATVIVAVDLLARNLKNLPQLMDLVWTVFKKAVANITGVILALIGEIGFEISNFAKDIPGLEDVGNALGAGAKSASETAVSQFNLAEGLQKKIDVLADGIDTGFAGDVATKLSEAFNKAPTPTIGVAAAPGAGASSGAGAGSGSGAAAAVAAAGKAAATALAKTKGAVAKVTDAQKSLSSELNKQGSLQTKLQEFGKSGIQLIKLRLAERVKELNSIRDAAKAEGNLSSAQAAQILAVKTQESKLASLKIAQLQSSEEGKVADALKASDQALSSMGRHQVDILKNQAIEKVATISADMKRLDNEGLLTDQMRRSFNQLKKNTALAAQFEIGEIKTDQIEALRDETDALTMAGLEGVELAEAKLVADMAAIDAKETELKLAGNLTAEAKKLLDIQRGATAKKGGASIAAAEDAESIDFGGAAADLSEGIADGFSAGADALMGAVDSLAALGAENVTALTKSFEDIPAQVTEGMKNLPELVKSTVNGILDGIDALISAAPQFIAEIVAMLPELVDKLFAVMNRLIEAAPAIISQLLDALIPLMEQVLAKLPEILINMLNSLGDIVVMIMDKVPQIIVTLAENIGPIIEALIEGLVSNIGKIVIGFIDTFIMKGGALKIAVALVKAIINMIPAIIKGLAKGLMNVINMLFNGIKIPLDIPPAVTELPQKIGDAVAKVGEGIKAGGSDVFAVLDISKAKSAKSIDKSIGQAVKKATKEFENGFKRIGGLLSRLWAALKAIWDTVIMWLQKLWAIIEQVWDIIVQALQTLWTAIEAIWNTVIELLQGLWDALEGIWNTVVELLQGLWDSLEGIWNTVTEALQGLWDSLASIFEDAFKFLTEGADKLLSVITSIPSKIGEGVTSFANMIASIPGKFSEGASNVLSKFGEIGTKVFDQLKSAFDRLNPANVLGKMFKFEGGGKGTVENLLNIDVPFVSFATGGIVPGAAQFAGDNKKNDTVAALLSPGEAVIPRSALEDPQIAQLVRSIIEGDVKFAFKGFKAPKISVSAPKLPSADDFKNLNPADLAKNVQSNLEALKNLAFGDAWDIFKDQVMDQVKSGIMNMIKSAAHFENGGVVPSDGMGMLHQSEVVLPTKVVDAIMGKKESSASGATNITLNANVSVAGGGADAGKQIVDQMFAEIRKRSANQKIMFESGLIK